MGANNGIDPPLDLSRNPQAMLAALRDEANDEVAFLKLLAQVPLEDSQRAAVELLLSIGEDDMEASVVGGMNPSVNSEGDAEDQGALASDDVRAMLDELRDLREGNDTLARALGACRLCWGGEDDCNECGGRGWPGSSAPDAALFNELVAPAVKRARATTGEKRSERAGLAAFSHMQDTR
jgi:hypothetical protein